MSPFSLLLLISLFGKLGIHLYLDFKRKDNANLRSLLIGGFTNFELMLWYMQPVDKKYEVLKNICNILYFFSIGFLVITLFM